LAFAASLCAFILPFISRRFAFIASLRAFILPFISSFFAFISPFIASFSAFISSCILPISPFMASSARTSELVPIRHNAANATPINLRMRHLLNGRNVHDHTSRSWQGRMQRCTIYRACQATLIRHDPFAHRQAVNVGRPEIVAESPARFMMFRGPVPGTAAPNPCVTARTIGP